MIISMIGLTLLLAKAAEELTLKLGLPSLLGPLSLGLLGSQLTQLKEEYRYAPLLFVVGLNFTAFLLGSEELGKLIREVKGRHVIKGTIFFLVPFAISFALLQTSLDFKSSILLATIFSMPSTLRAYTLLKHVELENFEEVLTILSVSEITAVTIIFLLSLKNVLMLIIVSIGLIITIRYGTVVFRKVLEAEEQFLAKELPLTLIISMVLTLGYASESFGLNSAVVSLLLGVLASEYLAERPWLTSKLKTINHSLFEPLFFVGSGALVNFATVTYPTLLLLITTNFIVALVKTMMIKWWSGWRWRYSALTSVKGGIDTALLASQYKVNGISLDLYSSSITVVTLNTLTFGSLAVTRKRGRKVALRFCDLKLVRAAVELSEPLTSALKMFEEGIEAVVVVDAANWPVGYLSAADVLHLKDKADKVRVYEVYREGVPVFDCEDRLTKAMVLEEEIDEYPVIAVVKGSFGYFGSVQTRAVLKKLAEAVSP